MNCELGFFPDQCLILVLQGIYLFIAQDTYKLHEKRKTKSTAYFYNKFFPADLSNGHNNYEKRATKKKIHFRIQKKCYNLDKNIFQYMAPIKWMGYKINNAP